MTTNQPSFPIYLPEIWAKSSKGESLEEHSWHTVSRMRNLVLLRPDLPQVVGEERLWQRLFWACLMHDFGKVATGFQKMLRKGGNWGLRHEVLSLAFVDWMFPTGSQDRVWVVAAVAAHHRDLEEIIKYGDKGDDEDRARMVAEVAPSSVEGIWRWLTEGVAGWIVALDLAKYGVAVPDLPEREATVDSFYQTAADRIAAAIRQYKNWVEPYGKPLPSLEQTIPALLMRGYVMQSDHTASAHTPPLPQLALTTPDLIQIWAQRKPNPLPASLDGYQPHQRGCSEQVDSALLTAPTGSGKTEAALLWAARQHGQAPGLARLFYTLPYQASMNAMQVRLKEVFPDQELAGEQYEQVGLQHGRSLLALYRKAMEKYSESSDSYQIKAATQEAKLRRNLAKLNYPPVRVFSPYQMLKGFYRSKGFETLLADYFNAAFIFDEIHAYEPTRLALILPMIRHMARHFNARFLVMSATFPQLIKERLKEALGDELAELPVLKDEERNKLFADYRRHRLRVRKGELTAAPVLAGIVEQVAAGESVLICVNTVSRAQDLYKHLKTAILQADCEIVLLDGRFNGRDRLDKEQVINRAVGSRSDERRAVLVVATQAIEVSLDIDLDTLYSDPAPLEALVQRFGRINRRRLKPELAEVIVFTEPSDGQGVYKEELVAATLAILNQDDVNDQPVDESKVAGWLDTIYQGKIAERWMEEYAQAEHDFEQQILQQLRPFQTDEDIEKKFDELFDGIELLPIDFEPEYNQAEAEGSIRMRELLVSISFGQYMKLRKQDRIRERLGGKKAWPKVVMTDYSPELGLLLEGKED